MSLRFHNIIATLGHPRWPKRVCSPKAGYSLILAVPPDLPLFLRLAVETCRTQDLAGLNETLIVADHHDPAFAGLVERIAQDWPEGNVRHVPHTPLTRFVRAVQTSGPMIHWHQIVRAASVAISTHVVLHDADLFTTDRGLLRNLYESCAEGDGACAGLDVPRFGPNKLDDPRFAHTVACWQMAMSLDWMRSKPPRSLMCQKIKRREGNIHIETTINAQAATPPDRIRHIRPETDSFVHFNVLITLYRRYQRTRGPFHDKFFRVLLIRLLADALDPEHEYDIPPVERLIEGINDASRRVHFLPDSAPKYFIFRENLERLFGLDMLPSGCVAAIRRTIRHFDDAYGWAVLSSRALDPQPTPSANRPLAAHA